MNATLRHFLLVLPLGAIFTGLEARAQEVQKTEPVALKEGKAKIDGALKADDEKDKVQKQQCRVYTFELKKGRNYQIDMVSKELDSFLRLEDSEGKELAKDDDGGGGVNARINFRCQGDGLYRVICTTFYGGTGPFSLMIQETALPQATPLTLKGGQVKVEDKLANTDVADAVQTRSVSKIYAVKLIKGKQYQIDMTSKDIDSFLRLEDATGKELAKDDDSGGGQDARIIFECPEDGEYRLIATTFFGGTGRFVLAVKEK
jgi:hypothetical protein